jgi:hypothetical protein
MTMAAGSKRKPKPKPPKYSWIEFPEGVVCYRNPSGFQTLTGLWEAEVLTTFHDAEMAQATKAINAILTRVEKNNKDRERKLSFIEFQNRHFLVWARYGVVGPSDDDATIVKALKLKVR